MTHRPFLCAFALAAYFLGHPSSAGPLEDGVEAHQRGDYERALSVFRPLAEEAVAAAQYNLGQMYRQGQGVRLDFDEAAKWYRLAAAQGNAQSQYNLGVLYYNALGVPRSFVLSHMWLTLAAMGGVENAARNRNMLTKQMTSAQLAEAVDRVRNCQRNLFIDCE